MDSAIEDGDSNIVNPVNAPNPGPHTRRDFNSFQPPEASSMVVAAQTAANVENSGFVRLASGVKIPARSILSCVVLTSEAMEEVAVRLGPAAVRRPRRVVIIDFTCPKKPALPLENSIFETKLCAPRFFGSPPLDC